MGKELRFHKTLENNQVASLYIDKLSVNYHTNEWSIRECSYIGCIISNNRRFNNDWWNGDKKGNVVTNKSTGKSIEGFAWIVDTLFDYVLSQVSRKSNDYSCALLINGTDDKRISCYDKAIKHICKKYKLTLEVTKEINYDGDTLYVISI